MQYEVVFLDSNGDAPRVVVRVYEPVTEAMTLRFLEEAAATARLHSVARFLIDARQACNRRSTIGDYRLAYRRLQKLGFSRKSRAAILVAQGDESHRFFETVAQNAGYGWRLFTDERAALEWLA